MADNNSISGVELKRYHIIADEWENFTATWVRIVNVRKRHGFTILFVLADKENNWFTWAVSHENIKAGSKAYYEDPERIELEIIEKYISEYEITDVEEWDIP